MFRTFEKIITMYGLCSIVLTSGVLKTRDIDDVVDFEPNERAAIELRAIFINCHLEDLRGVSDTETMRFQREELFKHNVLKECKKKVVVILKMSSLPDDHNSDEYIPIDHILEGPNKKRIRLLNPYVLRVRWEPPVQSYKLHRVDIVTGLISNSNVNDMAETVKKYKTIRRRNSVYLEPDKWSKSFETTTSIFTSSPETLGVTTDFSSVESKEKREPCSEFTLSNYTFTREKRQHNIIIEQKADDNPWPTSSHFSNFDSANTRQNPFGDSSRIPTTNNHENILRMEPNRATLELDKTKDLYVFHNKNPLNAYDENLNKQPRKVNSNYKPNLKNVANVEKDFALYEIGAPGLWCTAHIQLFEKITTEDGKVVWNDLTSGETVNINSLMPEWASRDVNIRYKTVDPQVADDFALPLASSLCLLVPVTFVYKSAGTFEHHNVDDQDIMIVPSEDVLGMANEMNPIIHGNQSASSASVTSAYGQHRRVFVRASRAILGNQDMKFVTHGPLLYLTLPHRKANHIQIDIEIRADDNELITAGSSGRITTAVSDNTRLSRTILTVQATNTGLAAARYKLKTGDCGPQLSALNSGDDDSSTAGPVLLPPRQTRRLSLELPTELLGDEAHCSVSLMNDEGETVAVRDVMIKKADRCFCVWHCDCVCLNEDPKLLCREMSEEHQAAAGLTPRKKARQVRSVSYPDVKCLDGCAVSLGVITILLLMGLVKAILGFVFRHVGSWGLDRVLQTPRKLSVYYESHLRGRSVVYDAEGYPVHPDTKERSVRMISKSMEFILNLVFFLIFPLILFYGTIKTIIARCKDGDDPSQTSQMKGCLSMIDVQNLHRALRRRKRLRRWMSPEAQTLSHDIWREGLAPERSIKYEYMAPLLRTDYQHKADDSFSSCVDSEQDDTEYVLMHMRESRESLAKSEKENNSNIKQALRAKN